MILINYAISSLAQGQKRDIDSVEEKDVP